MADFVLSQLFAFIAFALGISSFHFRFIQNSRQKLLLFWFFSAVFNAIHFLILGHVTAALLVGITATRFLFSAYKPGSRYLYLFIMIAVVSFAFSFENYLSILGLLATLVGTVGGFNKNEMIVRLCMMGASILWATHNALAASPVAAAMEISFFISNLIAWVRLNRQQRF